MGMDLSNEKGEWHLFNNTSWRYILQLARDQGWEPIGTVRDVMINSPKVVGHEIKPVTRRDTLLLDEGDYTDAQLDEVVDRRSVKIYDPDFVPEYKTDTEFGYFSNNGQLVTEKDVLAIAVALEKAVDLLLAPRIEPALDFTPDHIYGRMADEMQRLGMEATSENVVRKPIVNKEPTPLEYWRDAPELVAEFAEYCRHGAFRIY